MLFLERSGYTEETYHTFSYSPIFDDHGAVAGMLCVVKEDTEEVIAHRRMQTLRDLGSRRASNLTEAETIAAACEELAASPADLPFSLVYLFDDDGTRPAGRLRRVHRRRTRPLPRTIQVDGRRTRSGRPRPPRGGETTLVGRPRRAVLRPAHRRLGRAARARRSSCRSPRARAARPYGFQVFGLNRYRPLDDGYRDFCDLVAGQLAASLTDARAYEFERAPGRDARRARPGQDRLLHQRQPRVPHPADPAARARRGRAHRRGGPARRRASATGSR